MTVVRQPLQGRLAMVTGASGGIGSALCVHLAEAGADVVLAGRSTDAMDAVARDVRALGRRAVVMPLDLLDLDSVTDTVAKVEGEVGPIDIAVSNSGISGPATPIWDYPLEELQRVLQTNLTGAFVFCQAVLRGMVHRRRGAIVVVGSIAGKRPTAGRSGYSVSKAGLHTLVRSITVDAGPYGVRANVISPGAVAGGSLDGIVRQTAESTGESVDAVLSRYRDAAPMGELVQADDIAAAAVFLASDAAAHITGADLNVTAGLVMH